MHLPSRWQHSAAIMVLLLVQSKDVFTVAIRDLQGRTLLGAGDSERLAEFPDTERGDSWTDSGLLLVESFDLQPAGLGQGKVVFGNGGR